MDPILWILLLISISIKKTPQMGMQTEGEIQLSAVLLALTILSQAENLLMDSKPIVREGKMNRGYSW